MAKQLYFIAIELPEPFKQEIRDWKLVLSEKYNANHALKTPPHITLQMPMRIEEEHEDDLIQTFDQKQSFPCIGKVYLKNISSFPPRTIFIDVKSEGLVLELFEKVQNRLTELTFILDTSLPSSFHPHVTLMTRDLVKKNFQSAWRDLKDIEFTKEIEIKAFHLYKHDGKFWRVLKEYQLKT